MRKVSTLIPAQQQAAIASARELLAHCESGICVAFTAIEEHPDRTYAIVGNKTASRHETAGMLLDAAVTRILDED